MRRLTALALLSLFAGVAGCGDKPPSCIGVCKAPTLTTLARIAGQPSGNGSVDGSGAAAHFADPWTFAGDGAG
ncbi:MAG: hypothetical protein ACXVCV_16165, partial [Polyangia bacterium]